MDVFTGAGEVVTTRPGDGPVRHLPQLLRLARLRHPAPDQARAGARPGRAAARAVRRRRAARQDGRRDRRDPASTTGSGSTASTASRSSRGSTTSRWPAGSAPRRATRPRSAASRAAGEDQRLHRPADLLPLDPAARDRPADDLRLPVALGHRLVLVLAARSAPRTRASAGSGRSGGGAPTSTTGWSASTTAPASWTSLDRRTGRPQREQVVQDVEIPVERLAEFLDWFDAEVGMRPVWLCPLVSPAPARAASGRPTRSRPGTTYVNVGFWGTVHVGPDAPDAPAQPRDRGQGPRARRPQVALLRGLLRPRDVRPAVRRRRTWPHVKKRYDPDDRLTEPLRQGGDETMTHSRSTSSPIAEALNSMLKEPLPLRFTAYDGSASRPRGLAVRHPPGAPSAASPTSSPRPATSASVAPTSPATSR